MIKIEYPGVKPSVKNENGKEIIFCTIRKRWFKITPEEWVRQNFLLYLIHVLHYPAALISVEKQLITADVKKRFDIVIYKDSVPFMIVECKEMNVALSGNTISQILNYNVNIQAAIMVVTNGSYCAGFEKKGNEFVEIYELPGRD